MAIQQNHRYCYIRHLGFKVREGKLTITRIKLLVVLLFVISVGVFLLTDNSANPHARAFSSGPPAGYTRAPGEEPEACAECHVVENTGTGTISLNIPQTYTPGQSYNITVTHANADQTRVRWGFQLTALDPSEEKAGTLESLDNLTQVLNNQGPFPARQYIEHTSAGTFPGQLNGASWTFRWIAPASDVGPVTFYAAGNHANGDNNTSGDNIYFTFAAATFQPPTPDFSVAVTPSTRTIAQGGGTTYDVTVTPLNGFTGQVALNVTGGLPANTFASFQPATVNITDATPKTSVLSITSSANTPIGSFTLDINATSGQLSHTAQATMNVVSAGDADISISQVVSPNPAQVGVDLKFTITVTNNGPATASTPTLTVKLPRDTPSFTKGAGFCTLTVNTAELAYSCVFDPLGAGQSSTIDFTVRPPAAGTYNTTATASTISNDPFPANNTVVSAIPVASTSASPRMTVSNLGVRTIISGLNQPTSMAFIAANDFFVLEKASGRIVRVTNGVVQGAVLDLPVNSASERGLLGITLHPNFATNNFVYLYWTESSTGVDTTAIDEVPLLGNRVDRYVWNGTSLVFDRTLIRLRSLQTDAGQPSRGNHNGGVLRFGPDGKLYIIMGDEGRRGFLQNLPCGPTVTCPGPVVPDDQFGGPEPDNAHLSGVILRLNDDGTTPTDNPYFNIPTVQTTEVTTNIKKVFAYGIRNGFGMDFDPVGGFLWTQENGDDAFDEINRVEAGFNGGWIQLMGPSSRVAEFKAIEVARGNSLQQNRWPPSNIADTPSDALARLFVLPGSRYTEPEFSWKFAVAPSPIGFARGTGLGAQYANDLFVGASRTTLLGGYLFHMKLSGDRKSIATTDPRLADKVADNADKFDIAESESLVVGRDFGITTDIQTAPTTGSLYVVSLSNGAVYEVFAQPSVVQFDVANQEIPESTHVKTINVVRIGDTSNAATVDYATSDGTANERSDYTTARGTLRFAPGETQKSFDILITDDARTEPAEGFVVTLSNPTGTALLNTPTSVTLSILDNDNPPPATNPIDDTAFFVRQHYADFLNREPDVAGFNFWTGEIEACGANAQCREIKRINVSAAFFLSIEFQETGFLVYRLYEESFDRQPRYAEFIADTQEIGRGVVVGVGNWEQQLAANKASFADAWVQRAAFKSAFDNLSNLDYVNRLYSNAGVTPATAERDAFVAALNTGTKTRARVLLDVADSAAFKQFELNRAFVLMEYFGYLRRNPDDPPDSNRGGYDFWLQKLNQFNGNFVQAEMVKAFITSTEYRQRFGP